MLNRKCPSCGKPFTTWPSQNQLYCSRDCAGTAKSDPAARFWAKVDQSGDCWVWTAGKTKAGYGIFHPRHGLTVYAHRYAFELTYGAMPEGQMACHRCDNPPCVRPDHLFAGAALDNAADMTAKGRHWTTANSAAWAQHRANVPRGEHHPSARLNENDVRNIRAAVANGAHHRGLAEQYGVAQSLISGIVSRKRWAHVA